MSSDDATSAVVEPTSREWRAKLHLHLSIDTPNGHREQVTIAEMSRCAVGRWTFKISRDGTPHEFSGSGDMPALIEAEGMLVILLPRPDLP